MAVCGGGSAGLAAALTAAREGARVLLVERHGMLGGMGTVALIHSFCGLYLLGRERVLANPGFPGEMARLMERATGLGPVRMGRVEVLLQHPVEFARIADELVGAEERVTLRLHTEVGGIERGADGWELSLNWRGQHERVAARALVDASGDALLADWVGGLTRAPEAAELQRPGYVFSICGAGDDAVAEEARLALAHAIVAAVRRGTLPRAAMGASFRATGRPGEIFVSIDLAGGDGGYDPLAAACLTTLETAGRALAAALHGFLRAEVAGFRESFIGCWPVRAGVRESRCWVGQATLTSEDILNARRGDDDIALASWPMELRETTRGPKLRYPPDERPCGIPLGCLVAAGVERVFAAGRCISADHHAQASIRVMGTCFATGQAAGFAAAHTAAAVPLASIPRLLAARFGPWPD